MKTTYVIRWKSKINGRAGRGTKEFSHEEGDRLVAELNSEYPNIEHELIPTPAPVPEPAEVLEDEEQLSTTREPQAPSEETHKLHALAYR